MELTCTSVIFAASLLNFYIQSVSTEWPFYGRFDEDPFGLLSEVFFMCHSMTPGVVIAKWSCTSRNYFVLLLLLCDNISKNLSPPNALYPCGICNREVVDSDPAICCDSWIHVLCDPKVSLSEYKLILSNPSADSWICSACETQINQLSRVSNKSTPSDWVTCVCLNA